FSAGCSVLAVTVAGSHGSSGDTDVLLRAAGQVFRGWQATLASVLAGGGRPCRYRRVVRAVADRGERGRRRAEPRREELRAVRRRPPAVAAPGWSFLSASGE